MQLTIFKKQVPAHLSCPPWQKKENKVQRKIPGPLVKEQDKQVQIYAYLR